MTGDSDSNRSEPQGEVREDQLKAGAEQRHDRRNTNQQRGRGRAMRVLGSPKSECHRKTPVVELGGPGRKMLHLTRGDLRGAHRAEVSRGRSSEDGRRKVAGAKGRRTEGNPKQLERGRGARRPEGAEDASVVRAGERDWMSLLPAPHGRKSRPDDERSARKWNLP